MRAVPQVIVAFTILFGLKAFPHASGIVGSSGLQSGVSCTQCHAVSTGTAPTVAIAGPTTLAPGTTGQYTLTLTGGPAVKGGLDVAADNVNATLLGDGVATRASAGEVTHSAARLFSSGVLTFNFSMVAPSSPGTVKLYGAGNSTDGAGNATGDRSSLATLTVTISGTPVAGTDFRERCARRLSSSILGQGASAAMLTSSDPQAFVDSMLAVAPPTADGGVVVTPFEERFSRWINGTFNPDPGMVPAEDATYYLTRHVLLKDLPWKDLYAGQWRVDPGPSVYDDARVVADVNGLGYFRSRAWMTRYAGNEAAGYRLVAAYRIFNNVLGIKLTAAQNTGGTTASTRQSNLACSGCHFDSNFGLDLAARVLTRRNGTGASMTFTAPTDGPQVLLGGATIADDKQLINTMVNSTEFSFRACRLASEFVYGRAEFKCEGQVFDRCVTAFNATGKITSAIAAIAKDPSFCQ